jgi:FkbM family methyltransferase
MRIEDYLIELKKEGFLPKKILDIGANVGGFSIFCKNLFNCEILMIEGNENCESDLIATGINYKIELLGDTNRTVDFYINTNNPKCTGSSYYKEVTHHYKDSIKKEKSLVRLDDITNDIYDIIKIDTQGSELDIIKGGIRTVKSAKYLIIEVPIKEYNEGSPLLEEILSFIKSIGFDRYHEIEEHFWLSHSGEFEYGEVFQKDYVFIK